MRTLGVELAVVLFDRAFLLGFLRQSFLIGKVHLSFIVLSLGICSFRSEFNLEDLVFLQIFEFLSSLGRHLFENAFQ